MDRTVPRHGMDEKQVGTSDRLPTVSLLGETAHILIQGLYLGTVHVHVLTRPRGMAQEALDKRALPPGRGAYHACIVAGHTARGGAIHRGRCFPVGRRNGSLLVCRYGHPFTAASARLVAWVPTSVPQWSIGTLAEMTCMHTSARPSIHGWTNDFIIHYPPSGNERKKRTQRLDVGSEWLSTEHREEPRTGGAALWRAVPVKEVGKYYTRSGSSTDLLPLG